MVVVRKLSGGDYFGAVFQLATVLNAQEIVADPVISGHRYYVRERYFAKLRNVDDEGWSTQGGTKGGLYNEDYKFFDLGSL
jgi:hypothetical protein